MEINSKELLKKALTASENAYAPYSKFKVGASVLFEDGKIYSGCNVENASYGLALCAERNALSTAIADGQKSKPVAVAIKCQSAKFCPPCGACRQWIMEFNPDAKVILENEDGTPKVLSISELLPYAFELDN